jgi:hypothetical protein
MVVLRLPSSVLINVLHWINLVRHNPPAAGNSPAAFASRDTSGSTDRHTQSPIDSRAVLVFVFSRRVSSRAKSFVNGENIARAYREFLTYPNYTAQWTPANGICGNRANRYYPRCIDRPCTIDRRLIIYRLRRLVSAWIKHSSGCADKRTN